MGAPPVCEAGWGEREQASGNEIWQPQGAFPQEEEGAEAGHAGVKKEVHEGREADVKEGQEGREEGGEEGCEQLEGGRRRRRLQA